MKFGRRIRAVRKNAGYTQNDFCSLLDIPQSTLSAYETDRMQPTVSSLVKIATKFNVSLDWLCGIETSPKTNEFYNKLDFLIKEHGITKNKLLTDLNLNRNSFGNWQKQGSKPRTETVERIAEYFNVTAESLSNDNLEIEYQLSAKRSSAVKLRSYYQRTVSLNGDYTITDEKLNRFSKLLNASITFLMNISEITYKPEIHSVNEHSSLDFNTLLDILELSDKCVDNEAARTVMVQISRIILYRVETSGKDLSNCSALSEDKLKFLYYGTACNNKYLNYGFNFSEIATIHEYTGLNYNFLLTGKSKGA